jgi:hypothetical protein
MILKKYLFHDKKNHLISIKRININYIIAMNDNMYLGSQ